MDDRAICLPWVKNFGLTPLGQTVVYEEFYKRIIMEISKCVNNPWASGQKLKHYRKELLRHLESMGGRYKSRD